MKSSLPLLACLLLSCSAEQPRPTSFGEVFDKDNPFHIQLPKIDRWAEEAYKRVRWTGIRELLKSDGLAVRGYGPSTTNLVAGSVKWSIDQAYECRLDIIFCEDGVYTCQIDIYGDVAVDVFERQCVGEHFTPLNRVLRSATYRTKRKRGGFESCGIAYYPDSKYDPARYVMKISTSHKEGGRWIQSTSTYCARKAKGSRAGTNEEIVAGWAVVEGHDF